MMAGTVLALRDNAYPDGTRSQNANCYDNYRLSDGSIFDTRTSQNHRIWVSRGYG